MDTSNPDEQDREERIKKMLDEQRRQKAGDTRSTKERIITQKIQAVMPKMTPETAQQRARWLLWMMCLNGWDQIEL